MTWYLEKKNCSIMLMSVYYLHEKKIILEFIQLQLITLSYYYSLTFNIKLANFKCVNLIYIQKYLIKLIKFNIQNYG